MARMSQQLVIVFDTSVLVPLILPASRSAGLFNRLRVGGHRVALTEPIYGELEDKLRTSQRLRDWMKRSDEEISQFLANLRTNCYLWRPPTNVTSMFKHLTWLRSAAWVLSESVSWRALTSWASSSVFSLPLTYSSKPGKN